MRILIPLTTLLLAALSFACGGGDDDAGAPSEAATTEPAAATAAADAEEVSADDFSPRFTIEVPSAWSVNQVDNGVFVVRRGAAEGPPGQLWFSQLTSVYDATEDNAPLETPADLAAFIRDHPWLEVLEETDVEVGGLTGVRFEVRPDTAAVPSPLQEWWSVYEETIGTYNIYDGDHVAIYVIDGPEEQFIMAYESDLPERFDDFVTEAEQVIASIEFAATSVATNAAPDQPVAFESTQFTPKISGEAASAWGVAADREAFFVLDHMHADDAPQGFITFSYPTSVYSYDGLTQEAVPANLLDWTKAHPRLNVLSEEIVTIGGLPGIQLVLASTEGDWLLFDDANRGFNVADNDHFVMNVFGTTSGQMVMMVYSASPTGFEAFLPAASPVIATLEFTE